MNSRRYWKNRIPFLMTNLVCMAVLTVFLLVCGNSISAVLLILVVWALVLLTGLFLTYWTRKRQMQKLLDMAGERFGRYFIFVVVGTVSFLHLRAPATSLHLVWRLLL